MILVAVDGSPPARAAEKVALQLAAATGKPLGVVAVWKELTADFGIPVSLVFEDAAEIEREWAQRMAAAAEAVAHDVGVEAEKIIRHGSPGKEICAAARERDAELIVIGSHGWGAVGGALFGSVSSYVLHHAPCPVVVVRGDGSAEAGDGDGDRAAAHG